MPVKYNNLLLSICIRHVKHKVYKKTRTLFREKWWIN